ncbi:MAG: hypothetical protein WB987_05955 [Candidatus Acidiferrales bacterium]
MPGQAQKFSSSVSGIYLVLRTGLMLVSALSADEGLAPIAPVDVLIAEAPRALAAFSARFM